MAACQVWSSLTYMEVMYKGNVSPITLTGQGRIKQSLISSLAHLIEGTKLLAEEPHEIQVDADTVVFLCAPGISLGS